MSNSHSLLSNSTVRLAGCLWFCVLGAAHGAKLVDTEQARQFGLQRAWFSQVNVDQNRSHVVDWELRDDRLFALTSAGVLQAIDSETGATLWTQRVGKPEGSFSGLAVNQKYVAVISGSYLYLFDRETGHLRVTHQLDSTPIPAPVMSDEYVFAALISGKVEGYSLEFPEQKPWYHQSIGRIFYEPTVTGEVVSWPTDRGFLYVSQANQPRVLFRVETGAEIVAPPAELEPYLYVSSRDGYLYCVHELSGAEVWRWSTGYPIITRPAAVATTVYVASEQPALHALHYKTGDLKWISPGLKQFVAAGKKNVYGLDHSGNMAIIEKASGGILGRLRLGEYSDALVNDQSDRIFLVSKDGLVQCFHESESAEPTYYQKQTAEDADQAAEEEAVNPFGEQPAGDEFTKPDSPGDVGSPFGGSEEEEPDTDNDSGDEPGNPFLDF